MDKCRERVGERKFEQRGSNSICWRRQRQKSYSAEENDGKKISYAEGKANNSWKGGRKYHFN